MDIPHICHFFYTSRIFENQILHPKKRLKAPKTLKKSLKSQIYAFFSHSIWKNLHLTENFYTGTACGACDEYAVWLWMDVMVMFLEVIQQVVCIDLLGHWQQKMHIFKNKAGLGHRLSD